MPFSVNGWRLDNAFITGGGYKYCQLGEGNCFLRFPARSTLRPVVTGWFAEFGLLPSAGDATVVPYPDGPDRFAGASYDPSSHYRGAAVFDFFARAAADRRPAPPGQPAPGRPPGRRLRRPGPGPQP